LNNIVKDREVFTNHTDDGGEGGLRRKKQYNTVQSTEDRTRASRGY